MPPYYDDRYERRPTVAEQRQRAARHVAKQARRGRTLQPVPATDARALVTTFWGKAWCAQLEAHADFASRLPRGRSYMKHGAVVDLCIEAGSIHAQVLGSELYQVKISIRALPATRWEAMVALCHGQVDSVMDLLEGSLSAAVMQTLTDPKQGILPTSREIAMDCSCPDGAAVCKHLAAVFYGVGSRLDVDPGQLFVLRKVDPARLMEGAGEALDGQLGDAGGLQGADLAGLFGIDLDVSSSSSPAPAPASAKKASAKKASAKKAPAKKAAAKKAPAKKAPAKKRR